MKAANNMPSAWKRLIHSVRFRLAMWFVLILALVLTAFSAIIYASQMQELRGEVLNRLEGKSEGLERLLRISDFSTIETGSAQIGNQDEFGVLTPNDILILFNADGKLVQTWGPLQETAEPALLSTTSGTTAVGDRAFLKDVTINAKLVKYAFTVRPLMTGDQLAGSLLIGTQFDPGNRLRNLLLTLLIGSLATLVIALAGGFWLADRAMRPVKTITQAARQIGETDLSRRLNLNQFDEIGQLADTFDAMLARIESAFEKQRQFTADASHELRTPLTIVNLETNHALAAPRKPQEYQRALKIIQSENDFMSHLVNDLLMLARMDAGQAVPLKEPLDLSDLTLEVVERLSPLAARNQVTLEAGELPETPVLGDRQYLSQMLTNLIENAIKYTAPAGSERERVVQIETGSAPDRALGWVRVTDSGPGIPAEHLPHLFDRFYRVDKARTRSADESSDSPSGSGLGLAIVQWIARIHNGEASVESEVGRGTTFTVTLPLAKK